MLDCPGVFKGSQGRSVLTPQWCSGYCTITSSVQSLSVVKARFPLFAQFKQSDISNPRATKQ